MPVPERKKFSILWFTVAVGAQLGALLAAFRLLFPVAWERQLAAGWTGFVLVFLIAHLGVGFFEWFFHRYVLHTHAIRGLGKLASAHRNHHGLTPIRLQAAAPGSDRYVLNRYPIVDEPQFEDSAFPFWALPAFWLLFSPVLFAAQFLAPELPVLLGGFVAIAWSMSLYEILHAVEHQPYEWWKHATEHPQLGFLWRRVYGFHHMHHANIKCNEAISGFFGLPVADWVMGTYHQPRELLLEGRVASARDFAVPAAPRVVRWLDGWAHRRESRMRHRGRELSGSA